MGAYSPAPVVTPALHARIMREVILPAVTGMAADGIPYTGFLYAGVMIDAAGTPKVLEFNCRLGDPETQPIMVRLKSDLVDLLEHGVDGTLDQAEAEWDRRAALGVVLAAHGYPGDAAHGRRDRRPRPRDAETHPDCNVFHAGTALADGAVVVTGGRVLCVTALGDSVRQAQRAAYARHRRDPLRRHAVPQRHRPSRPRGAADAARPCGGAVARDARRSGVSQLAPIARPRMDITAPRSTS